VLADPQGGAAAKMKLHPLLRGSAKMAVRSYGSTCIRLLMLMSYSPQVMAEILALWQREGHRALVFSQTRQMLDIIERYVQVS
jgi:DNA excision repair protein ERCC-6